MNGIITAKPTNLLNALLEKEQEIRENFRVDKRLGRDLHDGRGNLASLLQTRPYCLAVVFLGCQTGGREKDGKERERKN